jgi:hypothetical protein
VLDSHRCELFLLEACPQAGIFLAGRAGYTLIRETSLSLKGGGRLQETDAGSCK